LIIAISLQQAEPPLADCIGLWYATDYSLLAILGKNPSQIRVGELDCDLYTLEQMPDKAYRGTWAGIKDLGINAMGINSVRSTDHQTDIVKGETRLTLGLFDEHEKLKYFKLALINDSGNTKYADMFQRLGSFADLSFAGHYSNAHYDLQIEHSADGINYEGSATYNGKGCIFKGKRTGIRMIFTFTNASNNEVAGSGYLEWLPSPRQIKKDADDHELVTDRLYLNVTIPSELPNGERLFLSKVK